MAFSKERIRNLVHSIASNLGRAEAEGVNQLIVFHFLYPFRLELAKQNVGKEFEFRLEQIDLREFDFVVGVFRRIAARMPEAFRVDDGAISPMDFSGKIVGWHNVGNIERYWQPGVSSEPNPIDQIIDQVFAESTNV